MAADPTQAEVLAWLVRTRRTPADAVDNFWPDASPADRLRHGNRVRQWAHQARRRGEPAAPPKHTSTPPGALDGGDDLEEEDAGPKVPRPELRPEVAQLDRVAWLEGELIELDADIRWVRAQGKPALVSKLHAELRAVRDELDEARADRQKVRSIDRTPAAVAEATTKRAALLERLRARRLQAQDPRTRTL